MIKKEIFECGTWCKEADIEVMDTNRAWEDYGGDRIKIYTIGFVSQKSTYNVYTEKYNIEYFLPIIERMFVLYELCGLDDYGIKVIKNLIKTEGIYPRETDLITHVQILDQYNTEKVKEYLDSIKTNKIPVLLRRMNWEIQEGDFCHRCWQDTGFNRGDWMQIVYGRLGFGFIDRKYLLNHRAILFRKFR